MLFFIIFCLFSANAIEIEIKSQQLGSMKVGEMEFVVLNQPNSFAYSNDTVKMVILLIYSPIYLGLFYSKRCKWIDSSIFERLLIEIHCTLSTQN